MTLSVITWNQGLEYDSTALTDHVEASDADVVTVCQQEAGSGILTPPSWDQVLKLRLRGMTKITSMQFANQYLTVFLRKGAQVSVKVPLSGYSKYSISGKGGQWAHLQMSNQYGCSNVTVACAHLPTQPETRTKALIALMLDASAHYSPSPACTAAHKMDWFSTDELPIKECWRSLNSFLITGDFNYRLDGKLKRPQLSDDELLAWLRKAVSERRWGEMLMLDMLPTSGLLYPSVGFECNRPDSPPTYKVDPEIPGCDSRDIPGEHLEDCFFNPKKGLKKKSGEVSNGWLDRLCWLVRPGIQLRSQDYLWSLKGPSDHVPLKFTFEIASFQSEKCQSHHEL